MKKTYRSDWLTAAKAFVDPDPNLKRPL
ncbi:MAG: hypothetical protein ACKO7R_01560, partial [Pseudanabaena sp.]